MHFIFIHEWKVVDNIRDLSGYSEHFEHIYFQIVQNWVSSASFFWFLAALEEDRDGLLVVASHVIVVEQIDHCDKGVKGVFNAGVCGSEVELGNFIFRLFVQTPAVNVFDVVVVQLDLEPMPEEVGWANQVLDIVGLCFVQVWKPVLSPCEDTSGWEDYKK